MQPHSTGYPSIDKPWLKYYPKELTELPLPECTIYEYLLQNNTEYPNDIAINYLGREIPYKELFDRIDQTAAAFQSLGVKNGEIVTVALPSIPEAVYCVYALNKIGAVANMIHPLAGKNEIINYLNEVESRVAVLFDATYRIISDSISQTHLCHTIIVSAGCSMPNGIKQLYNIKNGKNKLPDDTGFMTWNTFFSSGKNHAAEASRKDIDSLAIISHTGGTTGEPKGVMCSDRNINTLIWQVGHVLPSKRQDHMLVVLPPFVNYSLVNGIFEPLSLGHTVILIPAYKPDCFIKYVKKYKPNHINSIPAYMEAILKIKDAGSADLSCLQYVYYGGEAMDVGTEEAINSLLLSRGAHYKMGKGLGSTEMVSSATLALPDHNIPGSAGIPFPLVNCSICDPQTYEECSYNTEGEICFSGNTVMLGYYHHQQATNDIIKVHKDGQRWLHTGDLGYISDDGDVFVTGRIKRILMTKGKDQQITKIFPDRIEKVLYSHPAIDLCCVIGIPDEQRINYPKAYIVLKQGTEESEKTTNSIIEFCKQNLPEYMVPEEIEYRIDLPRTDRGKVDYRVLEKQTQNVESASPIQTDSNKLSIADKFLISVTKRKLNRVLNLSNAVEIPSDGIKEYRDIPYMNRAGKELRMDIYVPDQKTSEDLPVIINIHGGALIMGDKSVSTGFCRQLARRGYLVCSLEYRMVPAVRVYEQFDDVCAGMDFIGRKLVDFNVDFTRIYIVAESAGAYLATYVAAMRKSKALQNAIGYKPTRLQFQAMGLISGMFYTTRKDATGIFLAHSIYGNDEKSKNMARYTNPEDPEIIYNIPPCYLVTSKADILERYTMDFAGELGNKGVEHCLRHMGSDRKLIHAYSVLRPDLPESEQVIDEIDDWFKKHAAVSRPESE